MTPTASAQIALFVSEIREHLQEEARYVSRLEILSGSFAEGFDAGLRFWQRVLQTEEDFHYAVSVLRKMLRPLPIEFAEMKELRWDGFSYQETAERLLKEIRERERVLSRLQRDLLDISPYRAEQSFGKEIQNDFEKTFQEGLRTLLG